MIVTVDEVKNVIENYYKDSHPDFILTKRITDNLIPIVYKGLVNAIDDMSMEQAYPSICSFLEKDNILDFVKTRQPYVSAVPDNVVDSVKQYLDRSFTDMKLCHIYRKSNHPDDQYLYMVTAAKSDGTFSCWSSWNSITGSLNHGHYYLPSEQDAISILQELFTDITDEAEKYGMFASEYSENQSAEEEEQQKRIESAQNENENSEMMIHRHRGR